MMRDVLSLAALSLGFTAIALALGSLPVLMLRTWRVAVRKGGR